MPHPFLFLIEGVVFWPTSHVTYSQNHEIHFDYIIFLEVWGGPILLYLEKISLSSINFIYRIYNIWFMRYDKVKWDEPNIKKSKSKKEREGKERPSFKCGRAFVVIDATRRDATQREGEVRIGICYVCRRVVLVLFH